MHNNSNTQLSRTKPRGAFTTHNHHTAAASSSSAQLNCSPSVVSGGRPSHSPSPTLEVPLPRSGVKSPAPMAKTSSSRGTLVSKTSHNPYSPLTSPALESVLPVPFYRQLAPTHHTARHSHGFPQEPYIMDKLLHGGAFVTFHGWDSIRRNRDYEEDVLQLPSPLQPMHALVDLLEVEQQQQQVQGEVEVEIPHRLRLPPPTVSPTKYGCHLGQFLQHDYFAAENFLTLRLLADVTGVTLFKCDFDAKSCCRVFVHGAQSYERLMAWSKRLRVTSHGVMVAHNEQSASDLERVHLGNSRDRMPYHTIPIEAMRTSRDMMGCLPRYRSQTQQQQHAYVQCTFLTPSALAQIAGEQCEVKDEAATVGTALVDPCEREHATPSPVPSSAYASDCEPTPVKAPKERRAF